VQGRETVDQLPVSVAAGGTIGYDYIMVDAVLTIFRFVCGAWVSSAMLFALLLRPLARSYPQLVANSAVFLGFVQGMAALITFLIAGGVATMVALGLAPRGVQEASTLFSAAQVGYIVWVALAIASDLLVIVPTLCFVSVFYKDKNLVLSPLNMLMYAAAFVVTQTAVNFANALLGSIR
jgi:hypothetical protein